MIRLIWLCAALLLAGCHATPTIEQMAAADYGPPPENPEQIARSFFSPALFDPYSAVYQVASPSRGWSSQGDSITYGWVVCGTYNAKNRFGGYVGAKPFFLLVRKETVVKASLIEFEISRFCR